MAHQIYSSLLFLAGTILALGVAVIYLFNFFHSKKPVYLLPPAVALAFGYTQAANLIYESSILACAVVPNSTLLLSGGASLLHLALLIGGFRIYGRLRGGRRPEE